MLKLGLFIFIVLGCSLLSNGYIQELTFHENEDETGNIFVFRNNVPDISLHTSLASVTRYCFHGGWLAYSGANYSGSCHYSRSAPTPDCYNLSDFPQGSLSFQSFRRYGTSETDIDSVAFLSTLFAKSEILVTSPAYAGLEIEDYSFIGQTGTTAWTIFEGTNFNGSSDCVPGTGTNGTALYQIWRSFNVSKVGSVVKGCYPQFVDGLNLIQLRNLYGTTLEE